MYVRLAFAVAAFLEPEILIVDEVLAVGDSEFQKKCLGRMKEVSVNEGRAVFFLSHNMDAVKQLCTLGLVLNNGLVEIIGKTESDIGCYLKNNLSPRTNKWVNAENKRLPHFIKIKVDLVGKQPNHELKVLLHLRTENGNNCKNSFIAIDVKNEVGVTIMQAIPDSNPFIKFKSDELVCSIKIILPPLIPGIYCLSFWIGPHYTENYDYIENAVEFIVIETPAKGRIFPHTLDHGNIVPVSEISLNEKIRKDQ